MRLPPLARSAAVLAVVTALVAAAPSSAGAATPTQPERALKRAVNKVRVAHGLRPLEFGGRIQRGAHGFAVHLRKTDSFYHAGVSGVYENLAYGRIVRRMARSTVRRWMESPGHRANVLRRGVRRAGFGVARGEYLGYRRMQVSVLRIRS